MYTRKLKTLLKGIRIPAIIFLMLFSANNSSAQARAQADVSITSVTIAPAPVIRRPTKLPANTTILPNTPVERAPAPPDANLKCSITVHNENDDDASQTMLVVVVPVEVSVVSKPANATVYPGGGSPFAGYLVFNLGNMYVGQNITVEFTFSKSVYGNKVGAYAYSASPDPNPANNYKDAVY
jgi:hypothetical protein